MTQDRPLVSIVVPMFNAAQFIPTALKSILHEKEVPIEVVVVNDRSTDGSLDRVKEFNDARIRVLDGGGRGAAHAMNVGFGDARGEILMFCDADDAYPDKRIDVQARWLQSHPEYDGVCGTFSTIDRKGKFVARMQSGDTEIEITDELMKGHLRTSFCTYAVRSALVRKVGEFREFFEMGYDLDFQLRVGEAGRIGYVPENFYFYRLHSSSLTHSQPNAMRQFFERTALELHRQRIADGLDDLQRGRPPEKPGSGLAAVHSAGAHIQAQLLGQAWREHNGGQRMAALRMGIRALTINPINAEAWKSVLALLLKRSRNV